MSNDLPNEFYPFPPQEKQKPLFPGLPKNVQFTIQVILSLLVFGGTWAVNNQAAIIMAASIIFTYAFNWLAQRNGFKPSRNALTGVLFCFSLALAVLFNPNLLPPFVAPSDTSLMTDAVIRWLASAAGVATPLVGEATIVYNILLKDVFDGLIPPPVEPPVVIDGEIQ